MQRTITDTFLIIAMCLLALVAIGYLIRTIVGACVFRQNFGG